MADKTISPADTTTSPTRRLSRRRGRPPTWRAPAVVPGHAAAPRSSGPPPRMTPPKQAPSASGRAMHREEYLPRGKQEYVGLVQQVCGMSLGESGNGFGNGMKSMAKKHRFKDEMKFMENFDPEMSKREQKKLNRRISNAPERSTVYDEKGIHVKTGLDLCDCLKVKCKGCFFACPKCRSPKCGFQCRQNRDWMFESFEVQGMDEVIRNKILGLCD